MTPAHIELHIEELVLRGFAPGDCSRIGEAVQRELARLLADQGVPPALARGGEVARLDVGSFVMEAGAKPETVGTHLSRAVYGGLGR
jgi:hypothetical protein